MNKTKVFKYFFYLHQYFYNNLKNWKNELNRIDIDFYSIIFIGKDLMRDNTLLLKYIII